MKSNISALKAWTNSGLFFTAHAHKKASPYGLAFQLNKLSSFTLARQWYHFVHQKAHSS